jgi:diguanylate cyclase
MSRACAPGVATALGCCGGWSHPRVSGHYRSAGLWSNKGQRAKNQMNKPYKPLPPKSVSNRSDAPTASNPGAADPLSGLNRSGAGAKSPSMGAARPAGFDARAERAKAPLRVSPKVAALLLLLSAMVLAAGLAWLLGLMLDGGIGKASDLAWVAPLAAAVGVVAVAVPVAWCALRLGGQPMGGGPLATQAQAKPEQVGLPLQLFNELAGREWSRSRRYGTGAALLLVQLDRFARLVEARGSEAADLALTELLRRTEPTLRAADLITRYSESELAVFLVQADPTGALDVAERIRERAEQLDLSSAQTPGQRLRVTVSVGVAHIRPNHVSILALNEDTVHAVDAARQAGGNCVRTKPVALGNFSAMDGPWREGSNPLP